jgi:hypothetical protein
MIITGDSNFTVITFEQVLFLLLYQKKGQTETYSTLLQNSYYDEYLSVFHYQQLKRKKEYLPIFYSIVKGKKN